MVVEPVTSVTPRPVGRSALVQRWSDVTFLHWPVDPALVADLVPPGTRPDTLDGLTYVGLVPFRMHRMGVLAGPGLPYFGTFCETNVRLYSVDKTGRRGVVFLSMDAARLILVLAARASLGLPYLWSSMRMRRDGDAITYACRRRWPGPREATSRVTVEVGKPIVEPTRLERFLTSRWGLHVSRFGRTLHLPNEHPRWPLHRAELLDLDDDLVPAAGLPAQRAAPVSVLHSPGVAVRFGTPSVVPRRGVPNR